MVHWHCYKVSRAGHEDHHRGKIKKKKNIFGTGSLGHCCKCFCSLNECPSAAKEGSIAHLLVNSHRSCQSGKTGKRTLLQLLEKKNVRIYDYSLARTMWHPPTCSD